MPNPIKITVIKDTATPELKAMLAKVDPPRRLLGVLGRKLEGVLRDHFVWKSQQPRKPKPDNTTWPTTHFWDRRIRNATNFSGATDTEANVTISDPAFVKHY